MTRPERKPNRLKGYDYSQNGAYFITICTHKKQKILSSIVGEGLCALPKVILTPIGAEVERAIAAIDEKYPGVFVDHYVIMPNHVHLLLRIEKETGGRGDPPLQTVIGRLKSYTTHQYGELLWQRSFYDHIIRNEQDHREIWAYIENNPARWREDRFFDED